jgi:hypothetical protein
MSAIIFHPDARDELFSAIAYYNEQSSGLGTEFLEEIKTSVGKIQNNPTRWKILKKQVRQYIVQRFPFSIFYISAPKQVYIVAIAHNKRKPYYWKSRVKI